MEVNSQTQVAAHELFGSEAVPAQVMADRLVEAVVEGQINPIEAHIKISRIEDAIQSYKGNDRIRDLTLQELAKYGKKQQFGDCMLEETEAGIKYDFSQCSDSTLASLYAQRENLNAEIKSREAMLNNLPSSGMADPETGEMYYPPVRTSKTIIKTKFKK